MNALKNLESVLMARARTFKEVSNVSAHLVIRCRLTGTHAWTSMSARAIPISAITAHAQIVKARFPVPVTLVSNSATTMIVLVSYLKKLCISL